MALALFEVAAVARLSGDLTLDSHLEVSDDLIARIDAHCKRGAQGRRSQLRRPPPLERCRCASIRPDI
jgi:hypothetical protein